ncbi:MAG: DNA repair protein RecN [Armatimonadota bacterium]
MLSELYVENFALIDKLTVTFSTGLNILTGETGAGKSIVIDAINVLLGERAGTDLVRTGTPRAVLQAVFDVSDSSHLLPVLAELGIEPEDGTIILAREVAVEGRNVARINGRTFPVSVVRQVGDLLVDLHGQHEHQSLLREEHHQAFLDALGDEEFHTLKAEVAALAQQRNALLREMRDLQTDERDRLRAIDLLAFQVEEVEKAGLMPEEEDELTTERSRLANAEKLHHAAATAHSLLYDSEEGRSVLDALGEAHLQLCGLVQFDATLQPLMEVLEDVTVRVTDACHELADYRDRTQFDPERLEEVEERLALIGNLKRKYGESIEAILAYAADKRQELDRLTHHTERMEEIQADIEILEKKLAARALELSSMRRTMGDTLAAGVQRELTQLGMPNAIFRVDIGRQQQADGLPVDGERVAITAQGIDVVAFHISPNPGEPPKPLARIASGGELSRIMLALKAVSARGAGVPTLIFDEIDTGIGGRTAEAVGAKLAQVADGLQVICVTHLAQLAFYADKHFLLEKAAIGDRTVSHMRELSHEERVEELARLQAGGRITDAVLTHVRDVLDEIQSS